MRKLFFITFLVFQACASRKMQIPTTSIRTQEAVVTEDQKTINELNLDKLSYKKIPVYFGTNRMQSAKYSSHIPTPSNEINYGVVNVSIPIDKHVEGNIEEAQWPTLQRWAFGSDFFLSHYFSMEGITTLQKDQFISQLQSLAATATSEEAFVFVHGYNNSFEDAAFRTAQLCYDLQFRGVPIMFSWPSYENPLRYVDDRQIMNVSIVAFQNFLLQVSNDTKFKRIHLIAHSMGAELVTQALKAINIAHISTNIDCLVLAAPDINTTVFREQISPFLKGTCKSTTIYCSQNDKALASSRTIQAGIPRLGESKPEVYVDSTIYSIDATAVGGQDFFDHAYFGSSKQVIEDINELLKDKFPPADRKKLVRAYTTTHLQYWKF